MGYAGTMIKWLVMNAAWLMVWALGSYILGEFYSITDQFLATDSAWVAWRDWLIYIWNYSPILLAIGSAMWLIARSQERDEVQYPYG